MSNNNLFYSYYDALFQSKDYSKETDLIFKLSKKYGIKSPKKVLEIGCGTGNHTKFLAQKSANLIAIDIDPKMVAIARQKIKQTINLKIIHSSVENLKQDKFDLIVAMFNVVTYIPTEKQLLEFMKAVASKLNREAIFIFDCWNGVAAIKDPPKIKKQTINYQDKKIDYTLVPHTDFFNQKTTLTYNLRVESKDVIKSESFSFDQTLWTPLQLLYTIKESGMRATLCSPLMDINNKATEKDWKIMLVAKKRASDDNKNP